MNSFVKLLLIFIFCENGGINKPHGITFNNNFIKLFIVGRAKTVFPNVLNNRNVRNTFNPNTVENRNVVDNLNIPNVLNYPNVLNDQMF
jgi:hypothetical protein